VQNIDFSGFRTEIAALVGQSCTLVTGTAGVGSMATLHFGELVTEALTSHLCGQISVASGRILISLDFAAWRCRVGANPLCSSSSRNGPGGPMETGLGGLVGKKVQGIRLAETTMDLCVRFEGDAEFNVFCDQVEPQEAHDNYSFQCERGWFIVGPASALRFWAPKVRRPPVI
jgi:hypothetical protein